MLMHSVVKELSKIHIPSSMLVVTIDSHTVAGLQIPYGPLFDIARRESDCWIVLPQQITGLKGPYLFIIKYANKNGFLDPQNPAVEITSIDQLMEELTKCYSFANDIIIGR